ncbi:LysM peptidoglycan-binding domain-containing protein [Georgenia alba]|uniref:LysM peptidoglycan-binding domain-containing protein n=1 Tax=Georgenia alba TaxID=2233858 RepID=A0ABW2QFE5_9MICO
MTERPTTRLAVVLMTVSAALCAWLGVSAWSATPAIADTRDVADAVAALTMWAGCLAAGWYTTTCVAALMVHGARATGRRALALERAVRRWGFPFLRRALLSTAAAGVGASVALGSAAAAPAGTHVPHDLGWGAPEDAPATQVPSEPEPSRSAPPPDPEPAAPRTAAPADPEAEPATDPGETPTPGTHERTYRVRPGDSLWSIAADHLGPDAHAGDVAAAWPGWYETNRDAIGTDPHLIQPDLTLQIPTEETR